MLGKVRKFPSTQVKGGLEFAAKFLPQPCLEKVLVILEQCNGY